MENSGSETRDSRSDGDTKPSKDHHHALTPDDADKAHKKRRKVNHACVYCRRSHMTCDLERPCMRCIKRNIGHLCHDEPREPDSKKPKGIFGGSTLDESELQPEMAGTSIDQTTGSMGPPPFVDGTTLQFVQPTPVSGIQGNVLGSNMNQFAGFSDAWLTAQNHYHNTRNYHPNYMIAPEVTHEFNLLNDFLHSSLLDDGAFAADDQSMQTDMTQGYQGDGSGSLLPPSALQGPAARFQAAEQGNSISRPASVVPADKAREYYLQAADPSGNDTPEERMQRVLKAKYDAGLLKPFNYVKGYARLSTYLDSHVGAATKQKILRQLDRFRPKFREKMHALTDMDLVYVEMWFEKTLMEYDRVFASMAVPACCWRRTGEIFRGNKEMAELIHVPVERLRDGKIALHEILTEESVVRYWEEFGTIAFDPAHDTLLTACSLKNPDDRSNDPIVNCCFSFMIRRDEHKVPTLIVGNFLPHDPHDPPHEQ